MVSCELLEPGSELHRPPWRSVASTAPVVLSILGAAGATSSGGRLVIDCIEWQGERQHQGYGVVRLPGKKRAGAHRVAWQEINGPIPEGMFICHTCDNPPCVNPEHLWLGTALDNARDRAAKGRSAHNRPHSAGPGERNGRALLTETQVREIIELHEREGRRLVGRPRVGLTRRQIGDRYGVSVPTVDAILSGRNWSHMRRDEVAEVLTEYALIVALVGLLAAATMFLLGTQVSQVLSIVGNAL
jgi:Flp pilus assembly pilin Flp